MRKDEILHHLASGYHENPEEKWLTQTKEIVKRTLNFDKTGRDINILHYARFKYIWKETPNTVWDWFQKIFSLPRSLSTNHMFSWRISIKTIAQETSSVGSLRLQTILQTLFPHSNHWLIYVKNGPAWYFIEHILIKVFN